MPRIPNDFTKEVIFYMIKCNDVELTDVYIGSTFNFINRKTQHKTNSFTKPFKIYQYIRDNGGWDNFNMNCVDRRVCKDMLEVRQYEQQLIEQYKASLNSIKSFRKETKQEADHLTYIKYAEKHKAKCKEYNAKNKDTIKEYQHQYRLDNAKKIEEYRSNPEIIQRERLRRQSKKDKLKQVQKEVLVLQV